MVWTQASSNHYCKRDGYWLVIVIGTTKSSPFGDLWPCYKSMFRLPTIFIPSNSTMEISTMVSFHMFNKPFQYWMVTWPDLTLKFHPPQPIFKVWAADLCQLRCFHHLHHPLLGGERCAPKVWVTGDNWWPSEHLHIGIAFCIQGLLGVGWIGDISSPQRFFFSAWNTGNLMKYPFSVQLSVWKEVAWPRICKKYI